MNDIINELNSLDDPLRMPCIDLVYAGGCTFLKGYEKAVRKMILTALKAAGIDADFVDVILQDIPAVLNGLRAHRELEELR